jgi:DNA replication and repair protein RecF
VTARDTNAVTTADMNRAVNVERLTLTNFRNYQTARVETGPGPVVITGQNGAGKTNLLEAVSLLAPGRGLRGAPFDQITNQANPQGWAVAARLNVPTGTIDIGTAWRPAGTASEAATARQVRIDGQLQRSTGNLGNHVRAIWLTPAMDRLFAGPAGDRRRFLDRLVLAFDPDHAPRVNRLEKLLRERNKLLEDQHFDASWLSGVEQQLAEAGAAVAVARVDAIEALQSYIDDMQADAGESPFPRASLAIEGDLEARVRHMPAVQLEDEYRRMLSDSRRRDQAAGRTLSGPHRADLLVSHTDKQMPARSCSTGEQKALLIAITLAHARAIRARFAGWAPLVLLDEIAAHLDARRRAALFAEIERLGCQAWMTGTDDTLFAALDGRAIHFSVDDAKISRR